MPRGFGDTSEGTQRSSLSLELSRQRVLGQNRSVDIGEQVHQNTWPRPVAGLLQRIFSEVLQWILFEGTAGVWKIAPAVAAILSQARVADMKVCLFRMGDKTGTKRRTTGVDGQDSAEE